jgi:thioredoxin 1
MIMRFLSLFFLIALAEAIHTPKNPNAPPAPSVFSSSDESFFGVANIKKIPTSILSIPRGGAVHHCESLADVDAILVRAGSEEKLVVIDFTATWCGPCKMIAPVFAELSELIDDVIFVKVDVDENPDTAARYSVSAMPTFCFIKSGEVVDRLQGASPDRLKLLIQQYK